jgi:hypothetical protein
MQSVSIQVGGALAGTLAIMALLLTVRRLSLRRFVELGPDALSLPTGLLQLGTARIQYSDITRVWEAYLPLTTVLRIATAARTFDVLSEMLPDSDSYFELRDFVFERCRKEDDDLVRKG